MTVGARIADSILISPRRRSREPAPYRSVRTRLARDRRVSGIPVVVLDDIGRLTHAKWELLRFLTGTPRLRIVAIVESFLPDRDVTRLRAVL